MTALAARPLPRQRQNDRHHALVATAHVRLMMLMLLFGAAFLLVILRLTMIGLLADPPATREDRVAAQLARADIVDRNGAPLARTIEAWTIAVHPKQIIGDRADIARQLAALMPEHDEAWYYQQLTRNSNYVYLSRHAAPSLVNRVHAIGEPAIVFERAAERLYPQSMLAAHVLGYLGPSADDPDNLVGAAGVERAFQDRLTDPVERGTPLALSIDARVQAAMESELGQAMVTFQARGAAGIVLDVDTGEVVAMSSMPVFNPNRLQGANREALRNNVTQSVYELGSTFKPITVAAAINDGVVTDMSKRFDATVPLQVGRFTIHDDRGDEQRRWLNIPETLIYSSNIATARIADEMGEDRMKAIFRAMGFDTKPDIELREKARPLWPTYWARTTTMTTAFGHGIAITPLQLANAYATLVNGGIWRPTTLLKVEPGHAAAGRRVLTEATSMRMRQLLRLVVLRGTGRKGDAPGFRVGGKTGTAEAASDGGYDHSRNVATFAAAFPMDAPRYVVVAMLDSPVGTKETFGLKTAAWNAAPVVGRVIQRTGAMLGVIPDMSHDIDVSELLPLIWTRPGDKMANVE